MAAAAAALPVAAAAPVPEVPPVPEVLPAPDTLPDPTAGALPEDADAAVPLPTEPPQADRPRPTTSDTIRTISPADFIPRML
jgi:hypothetical protein